MLDEAPPWVAARPLQAARGRIPDLWQPLSVPPARRHRADRTEP